MYNAYSLLLFMRYSYIKKTPAAPIFLESYSLFPRASFIGIGS